MSQTPAGCIKDPTARENADIWPVLKIYHMPWRTVRPLNTLLDK
jgi:hypothetical protein